MIAEWMQEAISEVRSGKYPVEYVTLSWCSVRPFLAYRDKATGKLLAIQSNADWKDFVRNYKPRSSYGLKKE